MQKPTVKPTAPPSWSFVWLFPVLFILTVGLFAAGIYIAAVGKGWEMLAAGCVSLTLVLCGWTLATTGRSARLMARGQCDEMLAPVMERLEQFSVMLNLISEQQLISDRAKAIAFREKDRDAVRRAIQEEIAKRDWETALSLVAEIEKTFGSKAEADRFRLEIEQRFDESVRRQIGEVVMAIDRHVRSEQWQVAFGEAQQLAARFPMNEQAANMPQEIERRRQAHKRQLVESFHDAVTRKDTDGAIEIVKKLDLYLTPGEAEALQESVRGIFKEKLHVLRTQFSVAVQDHNWPEAVRIGDTITRDFPNTQMAKEVRDSMGALREYAANPQMAEV